MASAENGDRLNGWKEIAAFFGKDERTVKRWEAQRRLPVHRLPGGAGTVFAYPDELGDWLGEAGPTNGEAQSVAIDVKPPESGVPAVGSPRRWAMVGAGAAVVIAAVVFTGLEFSRTSAAPPPPAVAAPVKKHVPSQAVTDLYLQGTYYWSKRTPDDLNRAVHLFNQAIAEDPNYAEAFVGLANCYNLLREYSTMPAAEAYPKAKAAAQRAIALDDTLAEAHSSLAFGEFFWFWDSAKAQASFRRALELNPKSVQTRHWYANSLMYMGDYEGALREISEAQRLDPNSRAILADKGQILYWNGRIEESLALLDQLAKAEPDYLSPPVYLSFFYFEVGRLEDHLIMLRRIAEVQKDEAGLARAASRRIAYERGGREGLLAAVLEDNTNDFQAGKLEAYWLAETHAMVGDDDKALALLRVSIDRHEQSAQILRLDPRFKRLHARDEFRKMVVEVGLPPLT